LGVILVVINVFTKRTIILNVNFYALKYDTVTRYNTKGVKKLDRSLKSLLLILISGGLLIYNIFFVCSDLELYDITWVQGGYGSTHEYIRFNKEGYIEIAEEKIINRKSSNTYDISKYNCNITLDKIYRTKYAYYMDYEIICMIDGENVKIHGSIRKWKDDGKKSLEVLSSDHDNRRWTGNPKSTYTYSYEKSYKDFDELY